MVIINRGFLKNERKYRNGGEYGIHCTLRTAVLQATLGNIPESGSFNLAPKFNLESSPLFAVRHL